MIHQLLKALIDLIYRTNQVKQNYLNKNPNETVFAADASKGIMTASNQDIVHGINWTTSQRAVIMLTDKKIICGKWTIPLDTISSVELLKFNSLFGGGQVLKVQTTNDENYQFGMQFNPEWTNQQKLPLILKKGKVKYSVFSIIVRVIAIGYLIYWFYKRFIDNLNI